MNYERILTYILLAALIACIIGVIYIIVTPQEGEHFTEFYILGSEGKAADYPTHLIEGENGRVIIGIVNHEWEQKNYQVILELENNAIKTINGITLGHEENWIREVSFKPNITGENLMLQFLLYRNDNNEVYRNLHLWIDVDSLD